MNRYWNLRDEYLSPVPSLAGRGGVLCCGCLLGWLLSYLWPAYFKASRDIYVGLNAYRTYSDTNFLALAKPRYSNIDNYHYWQMNQLNTALMMEALLQQTLDELGEARSLLGNVDVEGFRDLLDTDWRTAGEWSLSVSHLIGRRPCRLWRPGARVATEQVQSAVELGAYCDHD